jgi:hypothetical protein
MWGCDWLHCLWSRLLEERCWLLATRALVPASHMPRIDSLVFPSSSNSLLAGYLRLRIWSVRQHILRVCVVPIHPHACRLAGWIGGPCTASHASTFAASRLQGLRAELR